MLLLPVCMTWVPDWVKWMCYFKSSLGFFIMIRFRVWNSARMLWAPSFEQHSRVFAVYTEVKIKTEYRNNEHMTIQISICLTPSPFFDLKSTDSPPLTRFSNNMVFKIALFIFLALSFVLSVLNHSSPYRVFCWTFVFPTSQKTA